MPEPYERLDDGDGSRFLNSQRLKYGDKLAAVADELTTEWLRFGSSRPEIIKRLQLAIDDWYEMSEDS